MLVPGGGSQGGGIMGRGGGTPSQGMATGLPDTLHKRLSHAFQLLGLFLLGPELSVSSIFHRLNNWHPCKNSLHPLLCDHRGADVWGLDLHSSLRWSTPLLPQSKGRESIEFREESHK